MGHGQAARVRVRITLATTEPGRLMANLNHARKLIQPQLRIVMCSEPKLDSAEFRFFQDGNALGTTKEIETLTIQIEPQCPGEEPLIVLATDGWSIDTARDLQRLIDKCLLVAGDAS